MSIQFWRTKDFSDESFLDLIDRTFGVTFTGTTEARNWLKNNGYFTSYPDIVDNDLVLFLDTQNKSSFKGEPTTNFYSGGHFPNGNNMPQESGSNPTNTIIGLKNPGNSSYVLRQHGSSTEYQINLSSELISNTTYCLSGWFSKSLDYNGSDTMFHCRAHSSSGSHVSLGTGLYNIVKTIEHNGLIWKYCYVTITTPSDYSNIFNWYVGYGTTNTTGYRYYTNLQMELNNYPTAFVDGTRGATFETDGGWLDLSGNNNHADLSNMTFDSDGMVYNSGQYIDTGYGASINMLSNPISFCCWVKTDSISSTVMYLSAGQSRGTGDSNARFYFGTNSGHWTFGIQTSAWSSTVGPTVTSDWTHVACSMTGTYARFFVNGVFDREKSYTSYSLNDNINLGRHDANYYWDGKISSLQIYNTTLTDNEVLSNFNGTKTIYGL